MEDRVSNLRCLLDREFRHETHPEEAGRVSAMAADEGMGAWKIFPAVRRDFLRGLSPGRGDANGG